MAAKQPWFRAEFRGDSRPSERPIALIRRSEGDGLWDDQGCAYMMTVEEAKRLHESLGEAIGLHEGQCLMGDLVVPDPHKTICDIILSVHPPKPDETDDEAIGQFLESEPWVGTILRHYARSNGTDET